MLKVNISDKISRLHELTSSSGHLINKKSVMTKEKLDETFANALIKNGEKFALFIGSGSGSAWGEPILWKRMKNKLLHYYVKVNAIDAVEFIPK